MKRREFLFMAAAISPAFSAHASNVHPLSELIDLKTGCNFAPDHNKFSLVLFMTAQRIYLSCDGAILNAYQIMRDLRAGEIIEPIIVMPKFSDQVMPSERRNLNLALQTNLPFTILTGDLVKLQNVAREAGTSFETNTQGKVIGHSQNMFFMAPNGKKLVEAPATGYIKFSATIRDLVSGCAKPSKRDLCFG